MGIALSKIKSNPHAKLVAKGTFDTSHFKPDFYGPYATKFHKELSLTKFGDLGKRENYSLLDVYLIFSYERKITNYPTYTNPNAPSMLKLKENALISKQD